MLECGVNSGDEISWQILNVEVRLTFLLSLILRNAKWVSLSELCYLSVLLFPVM